MIPEYTTIKKRFDRVNKTIDKWNLAVNRLKENGRGDREYIKAKSILDCSRDKLQSIIKEFDGKLPRLFRIYNEREKRLKEKEFQKAKHEDIWDERRKRSRYVRSLGLPNDVAVMYTRYLSSPIVRGIRFDLSLDEFLVLASAECFYCGDAKATGIDRVHSTGGYEKGNCVSCCATCNSMKHAKPAKEYIEHLERITNRMPYIKAEINKLMKNHGKQ